MSFHLAEESGSPSKQSHVPPAISHCPVGKKRGVTGKKLFVGNCIVNQISFVALCVSGQGNEFADHLSRKILMHVN